MSACPHPFKSLPAALRHALLPGGERRDELVFASNTAARAAAGAQGGAREALVRLGRETLLAAWEAEPLDGALAAAAIETAPGEVRELLQAVAQGFRPPAEDRYLARLFARGETEKLLAYLSDKAAREPDNLYWRALALNHHTAAGDYAAAAALFPEKAGPLFPLALRLRGDAAFLSGDYGQAVDIYSRSADILSLPWTWTRLAEALRRIGDRDHAAAVLKKALAARPWHAGTLLRLHDLVLSLDALRGRLSGGAAVLLYSFNKASDLDATLASLATSDFFGPAVDGPAMALVLDNGSTDDTDSVIAAWADRLGRERLVPIPLPVNVGAPAARNWLMRRPEVAAAAWTAFLDDDVSLPPDWTGLLAAAAERYPEAGVWGCRVADFFQPAKLQTVDMFLSEPQENAAGEGNPFGRKFELTRTNLRTPDLGQFDVLRPCASVTGCCHLFRTERLLECGDFDIRFSPSQYDDVDHDLRLLIAGRAAVYQGHLRAGHFKRSGGESLAGGPAAGTALANFFKLHGKHSLEDAAAAMNTARTAALEDLQNKWTTLHDLGHLS